MPAKSSSLRLDAETLAEGLSYLSARDPDLARIQAELGPPPIWGREPGFPTLVYIILEQQVSLASARAAYVRLQQALGAVTPERFLVLDDDELKRIGFSRQKSGYCRGLALSIENGLTDLDTLASLDDDAARASLVSIKGVGPWSADIYLLMALLRPDVWPVGDLALAAAMQDVKQLPARPSPTELEQIASPWRPWRAVGARLLWHHYLRSRNLT